MHETILNRYLVHSIINDSDDIHCEKRTGTKYDKNKPDIEGCYNGRAFYIEGKMGKLSKRDAFRICYLRKCTDGQVMECDRRHRHGRAVVLIAVYAHNKDEKALYLLSWPQYAPWKQTEYLARFPYYKERYVGVAEWIREYIDAHSHNN